MSELSTAWMSEMLQAVLTLKFIKDVKKTVFSVSLILKKKYQVFCYISVFLHHDVQSSVSMILYEKSTKLTM